jgi:hypothetical protein
MVFYARAQQTQSNYSIKGIVIDSSTNKFLDYVTVNLKSAEDKSLKTSLSKANGAFEFLKLPEGKYKITLASIGYQSKAIPVTVNAAHPEVDLGKISIATASTSLKEVTVVADKPLVKQEVDRIGYDVQADPESKSQTVLDMLRKVPLVSIDADDNIQVKGSASFKVLINGRPSSLVARNPKDVFKSMPANTIQKIEVITTPPAKYDSEGLAGILNIITNKKIDNGYNGNIGARYNFPYGPGANVNFTIKQGKLGFQGFGGINFNNAPATTSGSLLQGLGNAPTRLVQSSRNRNQGSFKHGSSELSYEIDSLNLLTGSFGTHGGSFDVTTTQFSNLYDQSGSLSQAYNLNNEGSSGYTGYDMGLNYQLGFKKNKEQLLTGSYKYTLSGYDQDNQMLNTERVNYNETDFPDIKQINSSGSKEHTVQLDYIQPFKLINIEGGVKGILRNNFSDYEQSSRNFISQKFEPDSDQTNQFDYQQNVFGIYNSYQVKLKDWGVKAGLRLERTVVDADFTSTLTTVKQDYNNFIPSLSVQRKFKDMSSLSLGYTQRIERPGIWQLNPFVNRVNRQFISYGNPDLHPVLNHSFELTYSKFKKGSVNLSLSYSFANNTVENVVTLNDENISLQTWENLGKNRNLGTNMSVNYPITSKFNVNLNSRLSYKWIEGIYNGQLFKNDGAEGYVFSYAGYRFEKGWRAGLNAGYYSPSVLLQGKSNSVFFTSFSVNKEFLNKKATLSFSANNPLTKFRRFERDLNTATFIQSSYSNFFFRSMNMNFSYRFGKLKDSIKKNRRGINNDDVKSGGNNNSGGGQ